MHATRHVAPFHRDALVPVRRGARRTAVAALAVIAGGALIGTAMAGWTEKGVVIFLTMAESGLAWCL